jgi:hypothetical protein
MLLIGAPENTLLRLAELPLVTGPNSRVPVVYRWDFETFLGKIGDGSNPSYTEIWKKGDPPLGGPGLTDLTNPPTVEGGTTSIADPEAGGPAGPGADPPANAPPATDPPENAPPANDPPANDPPAGNDATRDSSPDSGCTICGVGGCICS